MFWVVDTRKTGTCVHMDSTTTTTNGIRLHFAAASVLHYCCSCYLEFPPACICLALGGGLVESFIQMSLKMTKAIIISYLTWVINVKKCQLISYPKPNSNI